MKQSRFQGPLGETVPVQGSWFVDVGSTAFLRLRDSVCDGGLLGERALIQPGPCRLNMNNWDNPANTRMNTLHITTPF